ncbi:MAG: hypothetical protein ACT4QF_01600 [Sporichthyaceae bacterium]
MANPFTAADALRRPSSRRIAFAVGVSTALVAGLFALLLTALSVFGPGDRVTPTAAPAPARVVDAPAESVTENTPDDDELVLPQPVEYVGGVPIGFPRSDAGAVAAAYGYSRIATGLDVQGTLAALKTISAADSGWFTRTRPQIADGLVAQRKSLGLPVVGSTSSALINVTPSGYRIDRDSDGTTTVRTLNVVSTQAADGTTASGTVVFRWALRWDGDQWLAVRTFLDEADEALAVAPFTSAAHSKGWKVARGG